APPDGGHPVPEVEWAGAGPPLGLFSLPPLFRPRAALQDLGRDVPLRYPPLRLVAARTGGPRGPGREPAFLRRLADPRGGDGLVPIDPGDRGHGAAPGRPFLAAGP